jgi:hypothetical protein
MPRYEITGPDGKRYEFTAPEGASEAQIMEHVQSQFGAQAKAPPADEPSTLAAGLEGAAQGLTFGFSDEIEAAGRAAYGSATGGKSFGEGYDEAVGKVRERQNAASEAHPIAYYGGEIGSSVLVPGGLAKLGVKGAMAGAAGKGLGARTAAAAKEGAAYGAAYGAGTAEGGLADRAQGALQGGVVGGVVGSALPAVVDVGSAAAGKVGNRIQAFRDPKGYAAERYAEAQAKDVGMGKTITDQQKAVSRLEAREAAAAAAPTGPDGQSVVRSADLGGENTRNLVRAAVNQGGEEAQKFKSKIDLRQAGQWRRIERSLAEGLGDADSFHAAVSGQAAKMDEIGDEVIGRAVKLETKVTPELVDVMSRPTMQDVEKLVARKLADEGRPPRPVTNTEMLHRMKVELDEQIGIAKRAETMGNRPTAGFDTRTLVTLKHDLLNAIDNPTYKKGLKMYAGEARLKNAAESARKDFFKMDPEDIKRTLAEFDTEQERAMWRLGGARAIADKVRQGNALRDRTENLFSSPDMQKRLEALYPDTATRRELQKKLVLEAKMADTRKAAQGNSTTAKQLMQAEEAKQPIAAARAALGAATGKLGPVIDYVSRHAQRFGGMTPDVADEILRLAMSSGLEKHRNTITRVIAAQERDPARRAEIVRRLSAVAIPPAVEAQ